MAECHSGGGDVVTGCCVSMPPNWENCEVHYYHMGDGRCTCYDYPRAKLARVDEQERTLTPVRVVEGWRFSRLFKTVKRIM